MITAEAWAGKRYLVYGLARSGLATVNALLASGAEVLAWDDNAERVSALRLDVGDHPNLFIDDFADWQEVEAEALVLSPGVPLNTHPLAHNARTMGLPIIGDIELFARARPELPPHKVVGITGTNGKSTTTALVHHILRTAGVPTTMGGNIGLPILAQDPLPQGGVYVLELSSFQIDLTQSLDCDVAVLLNITPDHLDRYESFEAYAASKARLFEMQSIGHTAVVLDELATELSGEIASIAFPARSSKWCDEGASFSKGRLNLGPTRDYLYIRGDVVDSQDNWASLQGPHNAQNAVAAAAVAEVLQATGNHGRSFSDLIEGLRTYPGLPHRMERVRELNGVLFINDSKATNAEAAAPALAAYPRIRWIVGGQAKTDDLGETAKHLDHVVRAYTIGEAGPLFAKLLRTRWVDVNESETLENAVKCSVKDSQPGEVVLLSPACASFDQFRDFEARGEAFRALVGAL